MHRRTWKVDTISGESLLFIGNLVSTNSTSKDDTSRLADRQGFMHDQIIASHTCFGGQFL